MKLNKFLVAALLSLSAASLSHATIYITGSTAMRAVVFQTMTNVGAVFSNAPSVTLFKGGTTGNNAGNGASYMAFQGQLVGAAPGTYTIKCAWSGSEAGIANLASAVNGTFITDGNLDGLDHGTNAAASFFDTEGPVDLAFADNAQSFSLTTTPTLTGVQVGIVPFKWVMNNNTLANTVTNITDYQIRQALKYNGKLALFTGNGNDTNNWVYVAGRDNSSGTRVNAFGISGFGIKTVSKQVSAIDASGNPTFGSANQGQSSGGTLAKSLQYNTSAVTDTRATINGTNAVGYVAVGYLGIADAEVALGYSGVKELAYNGISYSSNNVVNGLYNFWGNEFLYQAAPASHTLSSEATQVYNNLIGANGFDANCDGHYGFANPAMLSSRGGPTSDASHK